MARRDPDWVLEADPKRPYKAYVAAFAAGISSVLASEVPMPLLVKVILGALLAMALTYVAPNPFRVKRPVGTRKEPTPSSNEVDPYLWEE